jgi:hypothetical protein
VVGFINRHDSRITTDYENPSVVRAEERAWPGPEDDGQGRPSHEDCATTPRRKYVDVLTGTAPALVAPASVPVSSPRGPGRDAGTLPSIFRNTSPHLCHCVLRSAHSAVPRASVPEKLRFQISDSYNSGYTIRNSCLLLRITYGVPGIERLFTAGGVC